MIPVLLRMIRINDIVIPNVNVSFLYMQLFMRPNIISQTIANNKIEPHEIIMTNVITFYVIHSIEHFCCYYNSQCTIGFSVRRNMSCIIYLKRSHLQTQLVKIPERESLNKWALQWPEVTMNKYHSSICK